MLDFQIIPKGWMQKKNYAIIYNQYMHLSQFDAIVRLLKKYIGANCFTVCWYMALYVSKFMFYKQWFISKDLIIYKQLHQKVEKNMTSAFQGTLLIKNKECIYLYVRWRLARVWKRDAKYRIRCQPSPILAKLGFAEMLEIGIRDAFSPFRFVSFIPEMFIIYRYLILFEV